MAAIAAIGMFDGVHLGHRAILEALSRLAAETGRQALAFTFAIHPQSTITGSGPRLITSLQQKLELIAEMVKPVVLDFTKADFALTAKDFLSRLQADYGVDALVMGYNNHIGSDRRDAAWLRANSAVEVSVVESVDICGITPGSSRIRSEIAAGNLDIAHMLLGRTVALRGTVVSGNRIGRTIGFPTANISPDEPTQILPPDGAYAVDVQLPGGIKRGMANVGTRPTLADGRGRTLEVNIFDFDGELYGQALDITFLRYLRPEMTFPSLEALEARLLLDQAQARMI